MASFTIHAVEKRRLILLGVYKVNEKKGKILGTQRGTGEQERSLCMIKTTGLGGEVSDGGVGDRLVMEGLGIG